MITDILIQAQEKGKGEHRFSNKEHAIQALQLASDGKQHTILNIYIHIYIYVCTCSYTEYAGSKSQFFSW